MTLEVKDLYSRLSLCGLLLVAKTISRWSAIPCGSESEGGSIRKLHISATPSPLHQTHTHTSSQYCLVATQPSSLQQSAAALAFPPSSHPPPGLPWLSGRMCGSGTHCRTWHADGVVLWARLYLCAPSKSTRLCRLSTPASVDESTRLCSACYRPFLSRLLRRSCSTDRLLYVWTSPSLGRR